MYSNNNIYGKFYFIECDEIISRALAPFMQFCGNSLSSLISRICIDSSTRIDNSISYRCSENDLSKNLYKSYFEARQYSLHYPHLDISFSKKLPERITEEYIMKRLKCSSYSYRTNKNNIFLVTCSSTSKQALEDVKNIVSTSNKNNYLHIHCDIGNLETGGVIYCSNGLSNKENPIVYPKHISPLKKGDCNSSEMFVQSFMGATVLFSILINALSFNKLREYPVFFSPRRMDIDISPASPDLPKPIHLLGNKKSIKKRGKKKTKLLDDKFYILLIGCGGLGSNAAEYLAQVCAENPNKVGKIAFMDGDVSERKNILNQRFLATEIGDFKVNTLVNRFLKRYPQLHSKLKAVPEYLYELNEQLLLDIFELDSIDDKNIILLGGVDKDSSRREIHNGFMKINKVRNFIYIDSGNGTSDRIGQTVTGYKQYSNVILNPIATAGIDNGDILNNTEDIKNLGTCTRIIQEHPQHQSTSLFAACTFFSNFIGPFLDKKIKNHMSFFDAENIFMNSY